MKKMILLALLAAAGCGDGVTATTGVAACNTAAACNMLPTAVVQFTGISACTALIQNVNDPNAANVIHMSTAQINCLAASGSDCDRARRCLNDGQAPNACGGNSTMCDGNTWVACDGVTGVNNNNGTRRFDCGTLGNGAMCVVENGRADCGFGSCALRLPNPTCEGDVKVTCDGIVHREDCALKDSTCIPGALAANCRGKGAPCSGNGPLRCEGDTLVNCSDGQEARDNCATRNLGCFANASQSGNPGCALGDGCNPLQYPAQCTNLTLKFCNQGKVQTLDCGAYGFNGCSVDNGGRCTKS
jgi:hypothetical protein